jgi:Kdo2-lipid IVA lauroyltransferase/acyltransferase
MNFLEYVLFLVLEKIIPVFPLKMWQFLAKVNGLIFYYIIPVRKKTALDNLKLAFPEKSRNEINTIIKGCYVNVFTVMAEFFYMRKFSVSELSQFVKVTNLELISENLKKGKGLILISAHYGNWELTAYGVSQICGHPFNVIVKEQTVKKVNDRINMIRTEKGNKLIDMRSALREVLTLLKSNKIVAMLGDQSAPKENVKVDFFVKGVPTFEGAARFAIKTRSALLFGVSVRNSDGTYCVTLDEIDTSKYTGNSEEDIKQLTQEHVDLLVKYIKQRPDHWLWFHRRFKNIESLSA